MVVREERFRPFGLGGAWLPEHQQQGAQKLLEPAQEEAEVVAAGGEHGVVAVAFAALEVVAAHPVILLDVPDDGLDGCTAAHLAADGFGDASDLATDPDLEAVRVVVAAIALVSVDTAGCNALACSTNCPPLGAVTGVVIETLQPNS